MDLGGKIFRLIDLEVEESKKKECLFQKNSDNHSNKHKHHEDNSKEKTTKIVANIAPIAICLTEQLLWISRLEFQWSRFLHVTNYSLLVVLVLPRILRISKYVFVAHLVSAIYSEALSSRSHNFCQIMASLSLLKKCLTSQRRLGFCDNSRKSLTSFKN